MTDADIDGPYGQKSTAEYERLKAEWELAQHTQSITEVPPPAQPVAMTFDINWKDGDRSPVMFPGILGSNIEDGLLKLYGPDDEAHIVNMDVVSHINIWRHP